MTRVLCGTAVALATTIAATDWPQFLGPARDGHSPDRVLVYRRGGFEALHPKPRSDQGHCRAIESAVTSRPWTR